MFIDIVSLSWWTIIMIRYYHCFATSKFEYCHKTRHKTITYSLYIRGEYHCDTDVTRCRCLVPDSLSITMPISPLAGSTATFHCDATYMANKDLPEAVTPYLKAFIGEIPVAGTSQRLPGQLGQITTKLSMVRLLTRPNNI